MTPKQIAIIHFLHKHQRVLIAVFAIIWWSMIGDFLLLVTSLQWHWFRPFWSTRTERAPLMANFFVNSVMVALSLFQIWWSINLMRKYGYEVKYGQRLVVYSETLLLLILGGAWCQSAMAGRPEAYFLTLMVGVWLLGTLAFSLVIFVEMRRKSKMRITSSSGRGPFSPNGQHR